MRAPTTVRSFRAPAPEAPREDLLHAYLAFLELRNGTLDEQQGFARREAWLAEAAGWSVQHAGTVDAEGFRRQYARFDAREGLSAKVVALLAFVKINAGEAYGVEVVSRVRRRERESPELLPRLERVLSFEETYHTRILVGAAQHFGVRAEGAWRPPLQLKVLIHALAYAPRALYHPVLLASELSGTFLFSWLLGRVGDVFRDEPALRECLEQRLIEVLVDEVGHVAFNRLAVGPRGLAAAWDMTGHVVKGVVDSTPEYRALGLDAGALRQLEQFDLGHLPEEVRRRAFFA